MERLNGCCGSIHASLGNCQVATFKNSKTKWRCLNCGGDLVFLVVKIIRQDYFSVMGRIHFGVWNPEGFMIYSYSALKENTIPPNSLRKQKSYQKRRSTCVHYYICICTGPLRLLWWMNLLCFKGHSLSGTLGTLSLGQGHNSCGYFFLSLSNFFHLL